MDLLINILEKKGIKENNLIPKLKITKDPFRYLNQSIDFGFFYERENE